MVITKRDLLVLLNMDLELEYASAIQYATHASLIIRSPLYQNIAKEIFIDAQEDLQHAILLACQITQMGGLPSTRVPGIYTCSDERQMLSHDLEDVRDTIRRYLVRIEQANKLGQYDLAQQLGMVLETEKEHEADFRRQQTLRSRRQQIPVLDIVEDDAFIEKWQQRALNVPLRMRVKDLNQ